MDRKNNSEDKQKKRKIASTKVSKWTKSQCSHFAKIDGYNKDESIEDLYSLYGVLILGSIRTDENGNDRIRQEFCETKITKGFSNLTIDQSMVGKNVFNILLEYIKSQREIELNQKKIVMHEEPEDGIPIKRIKIDHLQELRQQKYKRKESKKKTIQEYDSGSSDENSIFSEDSRESIFSGESQGDNIQDQEFDLSKL